MARFKMSLLFLPLLLAGVAECQQFNAQDATLAMLERVNEPLFIPKCEKRIIMELPKNYMPPRYSNFSDMLTERFQPTTALSGSTVIKIKGIQLPDISSLMSLPRRGTFSNFVHSKLSSRLISLFMSLRSVEDFFSLAAYLRERINPSLFVYGFTVALLHRPDCRNVRVPPVTETFPAKFVDGAVFVTARERSGVMSEDNMFAMREPIEIPRDFTATDAEVEHRVAYFREDIGINLHHWHWHLIYPFSGPREVVQKNRRGELFYYMHQQVLARYDFERMCNKMPRTQRLQDFKAPLEEAYFPKLTSQTSSRSWAGRSSGAILRNINREAEQLKFDIDDLTRWRDRLLDAIHRGQVDAGNGSFVPLDEVRGIDFLGDMVEPTEHGLNHNFYGDFHNLMHVAVSLVHDPDGRHLETFGVLGESSTAMRDPVFYRIHAQVNDLFNMHKFKLPRYTVQQLDFPGVKVSSIEVSTPQAPRNTFQTYWKKTMVDLSRGLDFFPRGSVFAKITHLTHTDFQLKITINVEGGSPKQGLVRVWLAPKLDARGRPVPIVEQKDLFIELDKFFVELRPGMNTITRDSRQSAVTIPFDQTFRDLDNGRPSTNASTSDQDEFNFCGCGWPHHMLIPKGNTEGFPSVLAVMISNPETDWIPKPTSGPAGRCANAASYCGIRDQMYPDKRSMGYPFDRLPRSGVNTLEQFLTPNMGVQDVTIKFTDRTEDNTQANTRPSPLNPQPTTNRPSQATPRPASGRNQGTVRPGNQGGTRPGNQGGTRPGNQGGTWPGNQGGTRPGNPGGSRPGSSGNQGWPGNLGGRGQGGSGGRPPWGSFNNDVEDFGNIFNNRDEKDRYTRPGSSRIQFPRQPGF